MERFTLLRPSSLLTSIFLHLVFAAITWSPLRLLLTFSVFPGGSVGRSSGCHGGGCEFDSSRTNTQGLTIKEEKVLPL